MRNEQEKMYRFLLISINSMVIFLLQTIGSEQLLPFIEKEASR